MNLSPQSRRAAFFSLVLPTLFVAALAVGLGFVSPPASAGARSQSQSLPDLPGITPTRELVSGMTPLTLADVQFYIKIMRATVARYRHPTTQDRADLAAVARIRKIKQANAKFIEADEMKMEAYMQAGNRQQGMAYDEKLSKEAFHPTPAQHAALHYYRTVLANIDLVTVKDAHMPRRQWYPLANLVEGAAKVGVPNGEFGSGGDSYKPPTGKLGRILSGVNTANQKLVAPYAAQIRSLHDQVSKLTPPAIMRG